MRQWDWPKVSSVGNSQQHACDFLSSVTKTPWKCQERASSVPDPAGGAYSNNPTPTLGPSDLELRPFRL